MSDAARPSILKDLGKSWPGFLISAALLIFLFTLIDFETLKTALVLADYRYVVPALVVFVTGLFFRSFSWRTLLKEKAAFNQTFFALNEGYLLNNVFPFRLGELGRAFLLGRAADIGFLRVMSTIVVERLFDLSLVVAILLTSLISVVGADEIAGPTAAVIGSGLVTAFLLLHLMARNRERALGWFRVLQARIRPLQLISAGQVDTIFQGLAALVEFRRFLVVLGAMLLTWLMIVAHYYFLLLAFVPEVDLMEILFLVGAVGLGVAIPAAPGSLGVFEGAIVGAGITVMGLPYETALAYAIVAHAIYLIVTSGLGLWGLSREGESLMQVYDLIRDAGQRLRRKPTVEV